jgi:hypothetical protein
MAKTPSLGIRVQPETKAALEKAAQADMRSVSSLIEKILVRWLRSEGYLPTEQPNAPASTSAKPARKTPKA